MSPQPQRQRGRWAQCSLGATVLAAVLSAGLAPGGNRAGAAEHPLRPALLINVAHNRYPTSGGGTYSIDDTGGPSATQFPLGTMPVAFNNAGQMIGTATIMKSGVAVQDCVFYDGTAYHDFTAATDEFNCSPASISDRDGLGITHAVGSLKTPFADGSIAFYASWKAAAETGTLKTFPFNVGSALTGVAAGGEAVGFAPFSPGYFTRSDSPVFVYLPGAASIVLGDSDGCRGASCGQVVGPEPCPFGGCSINDDGTIVASGLAEVFTYRYGVNGVTAIPNAWQGSYFMLNNSGQVTYELGYPLRLTYLYSIATATTTAIPTLPGSSCTYFQPISLNNVGQILGEALGCSVSKDFVYWTWDAVHGTQNLHAQLPVNPYRSIQPLGIDDRGRILVALQPASGKIHWGRLVPAGTSAAR